jgi:hypothetical protein
VVTDEGILRELSEEQFEKADWSIHVSLESDGKVNVESDVHEEKQN